MRQEAFLRVRLNPDGTVAPEARARGLAELREAAVSPLQLEGGRSGPQSGGLPSQRVTNPWTFLGPQPIKDNYQNGGAGIYGFGNASVKINAIAVSTDGAVVFAGSMGGIAKSTDGGVSWRYVSDGLPSQSIFSLTIDSTNPSIVYAGTGDDTFSGQGGNALMSVGIYRSTDMGETWGRFAESSLSDRAIYKILVDPATSGSQTGTTLWLGARQGNNTAGGIFKSLDSGQTWTEKLSGSVYDMAIDTTTSPPTLFAARMTNGLYKSVDGGENWTNISGLGPNNPNTNKNSVGAAGGVVYYSNSDGSYNNSFGNPVSGRVYKSLDAGASWTEVTAAQGFCGGQCFYDQYVEPNPYDPNMVVFGGVDPSTSPDAGANVYDVAPFAGGPIIHSDQHSVAFVNATTVYIGNDGGVYKTVDGGLTWVNLSTGLAGGLIIGVSASGDGGLLAGLQDNGSVARFAGETDWRVVRGGDGGFNKIDPGNSSKGYSMYVTVGAVQSTLIKRTVNDHANTTNITPAAAVAGAETAMFYSPFFMDPEDGSRILWGGQNLYRSVDSGDNWTRIGDLKTLSGGTKIATIAEAPSNGDYIYVGLQDYNVLVTSDAGNGSAASWNLRSEGLPADQFPTAFAVHPATPSTAYVSFAQYGSAASPKLHVFKTTDTGLSWVGVSTGLPDVPVIDLVIDTQAPNSLFAATDVGVFSSLDGAKTWTRSDIGMPEGLIASALSLNSGTRKLTAGTYGRGVFQLDLPPAAPVPADLAGSALGRSSVTFTWTAPAAQYNVQAYGVYYSTDPTVLIASVTAPTVTLTGLTPNTTYSVAVTAANALLESANSTAAVAVTLASAPVGMNIGNDFAGDPTRVFLTSANLTVMIDFESNPEDTLYDRQVSTDAFATLVQSSRTFGTSFTPITGLASNTTYYFRARAISRSGMATDFGATASTPTLAAAPSSAAASGVTSSAITANWGANGNGALTPYKIEMSTDAFATVSTSTVLMGLARTFTGLAASTSYYFRVSAFAHRDGIWTSTVALPATITSGAGGGGGEKVWAAAGAGNASVAANWQGGVVPSTGDSIRFDGTSVEACTWDLPITVASVTVAAGFTGMVQWQSVLRATGSFMLAGNANMLFLDVAGSSHTLYGPVAVSTGNFIVEHSTVVLVGAASVTGGQLVVSAGKLYASTVTVAFGASFGMDDGGGSGTPYVSGVGSGYVSLTVDGTVNVSTGVFGRLAPSGIRLGPAVQLQNLSSFTITGPLLPGSTAFSFYQGGNVVGYSSGAVFGDANIAVNVDGSTLGASAAIVFYEASGPRAGAAYENDPLGKVSWTGAAGGSSETLTASAWNELDVAPLSLTPRWTSTFSSGTAFTAQLSTDSFATLNVASVTLNTFATFSGLTRNTSYYIRVSTDAGAGPYAVLATTATRPGGASTGRFDPNGSSSMTLTFVNGNGNPPGTLWQVFLSTTGSLSDTIASSHTYSLSSTFTALSPNTTYFAMVRALGHSGAGSGEMTNSSVTFAAPPSSGSLGGVSASAVVLSWARNGNPIDTLFEAAVSTEAALDSMVSSSVVMSTGVAFAGLAANTTYYFAAQALNRKGIPSDLMPTLATSTLVNLPVAGLTSLSGFTLTGAWTANGNGPLTPYELQLSSDGFATTMASSQTFGTEASFGGLASGTTYFLRVRAFGHHHGQWTATVALSSAVTPTTPTLTAGAYSSVSTDGFRASWGSGFPGGTTYYASISTDNFATVNGTSVTLNTFGDVTGLQTNTTYYARVSTDAAGPFTSLGSTSTLAAAPVFSAAYALGASSAAVTWGGAGNPAGTIFEARLRTEALALWASSRTASSTATFTALTPNATWFLDVRALSRAGAATAYASTGTVLTPPVAPGTVTVSVGLSSAAVSFSGGGNAAGTVYLVAASTDSGMSPLASSATVVGSSAGLSGLAINTSYYFAAQARGFDGSTADSAIAGAFSTLAADPVYSSATVGVSSMVFSWSANGNPAGTSFFLQVSSDGFSTLIDSGYSPDTSVDLQGLGSNTTYYLRLRAVSHGGVANAFVASATGAWTYAAAPGAAAPTAVSTAALTASWTANGNSAVTAYTAQLSTDNFASVNASSVTRLTSAVFWGLSANTTYYTRVRAAGFGGDVTAYTTLPSTMTLLASPALAGASFTSVSSSALTAQWTSGGNGAGTLYTLVLSTDSFATTVASSATYNTAASFFGLTPNTTYFAQVRAASGGNVSAYLQLGSSATSVNAPTGAAVSASSQTTLTLGWAANGNAAGTWYTAQASTDSFASVLSSTLTLGPAATFSGLTVNTTYYLRVRAEGWSSVPSAYATAAATATYPAAPTSLASLNAQVDFIFAGWGSGGNPAGTRYTLIASTHPSLSPVAASSATTGASVTVSTLTGNTSHYLAVTAAGHNGTVSAPALLGPVSTRPDDVLVALGAVFQSSLTFTITPQRNPAGTTYRLTFSTDSYATTALVADTTQTAVSQTGLTPNTTYQFRIQPIGAAGAATASALSTVTYAAAPLAAAPTAVSTSALTANWLSGGNAVGTLFRAQLSTDAFATVNAASLTTGVSAVFAGLAANTTYYARVRAEGHNGTPSAYATLPSTTTPLLGPAAAATTFTTIGFTSMTVAWASGGNGAGTTYVAELSTDNFVTVSAASSTFNLYALYGTGGFGPALLPATTYYARVRSTNGVNSSANVVLGSTATLAYPPSGTLVLAVTSTTAVLDWQPNGNPEPGTMYQVWRDVSAGFTAPTVTVVSTSAATATGLTASASYFFKVRALTASGYASAFDAAVSTATLPPTPGAPGTPAGLALGISSISWSWTAAANSPSFYRVYAASNPAALVASTVPASFVQSALAPNTPYGVRVAGVNASGEGALSAAATVYTLAAPPAGTALVAAYGSSATLSWSLNGNPAGTVAEVHASTTSGVFASSPTVTSTQTHTEYGLIGCTTYYLKVRNRNGDSLLSAFGSTVQFLTAASTPSAPSGLTADSLAGNRIQLTWTPSPTEGVTGYRLYYDNGSGVVSYAAPLAVLTSTETSFTTGVLLSSAAYNFALRARHRCGVEETSGVLAAAGSVGALASVRAQIKTPDSGKRIKGNRVSIVAELTAGADYQVSSVTFQMRLQGSAAWTTIVPPDAALHPNPDLDAPYFIHWDVNSIANGTYELRAVAYNVAGTSDTAPAVSVVSVVGAGAVDFDISEGTVVDASGNAAIKKDQVINTAVVNTVVASGDAATDPSVKVQLPAGALTGSTVTVSVIANPTIPSTSAPAGFTLAGSAIQIDLSNGQTALNGSAILTLSYPDTVVFGAGQELDIRSYDPLTGLWTDIGATTTDPVTRTATASTPHFSIFAIVVGAGAQSDLARVRVYPVPYKPNSGNPNEGKPYSAGDATSGIIFDRLPAMVKLQIYTLSGRLVAEFETAAGTGTIQWDVRNSDGRDVASGGYFTVISSPGHKSVVKKLAVIR